MRALKDCKVLKMSDGVEKRDGIVNFIHSKDVLAVLPTGFGRSEAKDFVHCAQQKNSGTQGSPDTASARITSIDHLRLFLSNSKDH